MLFGDIVGVVYVDEEEGQFWCIVLCQCVQVVVDCFEVYVEVVCQCIDVVGVVFGCVQELCIWYYQCFGKVVGYVDLSLCDLFWFVEVGLCDYCIDLCCVFQQGQFGCYLEGLLVWFQVVG